MATDWTFLKPWRNALRTSSMHSQSGTYVQFRWPHGSFSLCPQHYYLVFHVRLVDGDTQNVNRLKKVREAIVLFTVLALVNNKAFLDQFPPRFPPHHARKCYPFWVVDVYGEAAVQQLVWGQLCADSDPSPQFQQAMQKLKAMGLESMNEDKNYPSNCAGMWWESSLDGVEVYADLNVNTSDIFDTGLQRVFIAAVPLVLLLDRATLRDLEHSQSVIATEQAPVDIEIHYRIRDLTTSYYRNLAASLPWKVVNPLKISVIFEITSNDGLPQDMINTGILLNHFLTCLRLNGCTIKISCRKGFESFFPAISSAIAAQSDVLPLKFDIERTASELWPWLLYTISCCSTATLRGVTLTQANLLSIADVVRCNYPLTGQEELQPRTYNTCEFGFVDIVEGITVWPIDTVGGGTSAFVMPSSTRCRAWFKGGDPVEFVVPGFGRCRTRVGNGVSDVSRGLVEQNVPTLSKLSLRFASIDSVSLVVNFLELVGRNLRSLTMDAPMYNNSTTLDLSVLSEICPNLQRLETQYFAVVVTAHNESLSRWPIAELTVGSNRKLSDFTLCLRNRSLRMARELTRLDFYGVRCEESEIQEFTSHDGDFLCVTKEKFPIQSKAALISVLNYVHYSKPIHRLPADVLCLIFVFASTPARRSVRVRQG